MQAEVKQETKEYYQKKGIYQKFLKRPMDFILSLMAIIVLSPVLIIVAVLVRIKLGSPVLFKQKRPGLNEKIFTMYVQNNDRREGREMESQPSNNMIN